MTDARKRIEEVIRTVEIQAANHQYMDERGGGEPAPDALAATSAIIAIVREALLSDGVMAAVAIGNMDRYNDKTTWVEDARAAMAEALDATFGADDDGGEEGQR